MKQLKLTGVFLVLFLSLAIGLGILNVQAVELVIPNPTQEFYSNDFANVLTSDTVNEIIELGESTYKSTDGGQVVFVSIASLNGNAIEEYANTLYNKWKIGTEDRGILFIISLEDRKTRIEVGYGYEGVLTDIESNRLLKKFSLLNKEEGLDVAVKTIYYDITNIISGNIDEVEYPDTSKASQKSGTSESFFKDNPVATGIFLIIVLILVIIDFALTGGQLTYFILRMIMASAGRGDRNSGGGGRSGGGGSSSGF